MIKSNKIRIAIAGIGGVGGYIGGKLANYYSSIENIEIIFIAKGEMAEAIHKNGLQLISDETLYKCIPKLTTDNPLKIGLIDTLIVCTKNFSVNDILVKYKNCLSTWATIITTQNTVNGKVNIIPLLGKGITLLEGSIYIASNIIEPGCVKHISGPAKFVFGNDGAVQTNGVKIAKLLSEAGIDATYTTNITSILWKKFMFVSPTAIVTAIFKISFLEILENTKSEFLFKKLVTELMQLARAKKIAIDENTLQNNISLLGTFRGNVKSSFQIDLQNKKQTEFYSLVKYVIEEAKLFQVPTPHFNNAVSQLIKEYKTLIN